MSQPFKFIVLTNAGGNNRFVRDLIEAKLHPSLICTESPFHFPSSNIVKHLIKLIIRYFLVLTNKHHYHNTYQSYFLAKKHDIPFFPSYKVNTSEFSNLIKKLDVDAGFVFTFRLLDKNILNATKNGYVNFHPSLLPDHRGATPYHWTILHGDKKTGITFHYINEGIDSGPVIEQHEIPLCGHETADILYHHLMQLGSRLMVELIYKFKYETVPLADSHTYTNTSLEPAFQIKKYTISPEMTWNQIHNLVRTCIIRNEYIKIDLAQTSYKVLYCFLAEGSQVHFSNLPFVDVSGNIFIMTSDQKLLCLIVKPC